MQYLNRRRRKLQKIQDKDREKMRDEIAALDTLKQTKPLLNVISRALEAELPLDERVALTDCLLILKQG